MTAQAALFDVGTSAPKGRQSLAHLEYRAAQLAKVKGPDGWVPEPLPELRGETRVVLNAETTGLAWYGEDRPIGWSWWLPESGRHGYFPLRHQVGVNESVDQFREWQRRELPGKRVENINTKFDLHMSKADGVDLRDLGCTFGDVAHQAALLDDNRLRFNLDQLSYDILGWNVEVDGLGKIPAAITSETEFQYLHPGLVAPYAVRNVDQVRQLADKFRPQLVEEDLLDVLDLEESIIPVVVEMEENGTLLDLDLLHDWQRKATTDFEEGLEHIRRESGIALTSPDSSKELERLFQARGIPITARTANGAPSFTDAVLKVIDDPVIQRVRGIGHLADLKSKYLDKYAAAVRADGWLRFNLHQLRSVGDGDDRKGTVSGRFSAAGDRHGGYNPQQVVAVEKQLERGWCPDYVIRKLFKMNFAADMMQVEYRLFAHYAKLHAAFHARPLMKKIGGKDVWVQGPLADFHALVSELLLPLNPALNRKLVKNINFAKIYGAGLLKFAFMIGMITEEQYVELLELAPQFGKRRWLLSDENPYADGLRKADGVNEAYNRMFPAVQVLLNLASETASERGYVKTLMGRRARLAGRFHSALNRIIQGGAADINKRVLVQLYKMRKELGLILRLTVHDEVCGNLIDPKYLFAVRRVLNHQYFDLRVPILWDAKMGPNWAACK